MAVDTNYEAIVQWNSDLTEFLIVNNIVLFLYIIVGTIGNLLVLFIYIFKMSDSLDDRYFIPSLAGLDLLACIIGSSYALALNFLPVRFPGDFMCKIMWFLSQMFTVASGFLLLVIAIQRYIKVCRPFDERWTLSRNRLAVILVVVCSGLLSLPTFVFYGEIEIFDPNRNLTGYRCGHNPVHTNFSMTMDTLLLYNSFLFISAVSGVICISILYVFIGKSIYTKVKIFRKSFRKIKKPVRKPVLSVSTCAGNQQQDNNDNADVRNSHHLSVPQSPSQCSSTRSSFDRNSALENDENCIPDKNKPSNIKRKSKDVMRQRIPAVKSHFKHYRYSYMFMTITMVFIVSYMPRIILMLLESIYIDTFWRKSDKTIAAMLFLYRMYILNHVTNPFIYGFFDGTFRHEVKKLLFCKYSKRNTVHFSKSR